MDVYDFDEKTEELPKKQNAIFKTKRQRNATIPASNFQAFKKQKSNELKQELPFLSKAQIDKKVKEEWGKVAQQNSIVPQPTAGTSKVQPKPNQQTDTKSKQSRAVAKRGQVMLPLFESPNKKQKTTAMSKRNSSSKENKEIKSCLFEASRKTPKTGKEQSFTTPKSERRISFKSQPEIRFVSQNQSPFRKREVSPEYSGDIEIPETPPESLRRLNSSEFPDANSFNTEINMASTPSQENHIVSETVSRKSSASAIFDISTNKEKDPSRFQKPHWFKKVVVENVLDKYCLQNPEDNYSVPESPSPQKRGTGVSGEREISKPVKKRILTTTIVKVPATPPSPPRPIVVAESPIKKRSRSQSAPKLSTLKPFRQYEEDTREYDDEDSGFTDQRSAMNQGGGDVAGASVEKVFGRSRMDYSKSNVEKARKMEAYKATPVTTSHRSPAVVSKPAAKCEPAVRRRQKRNDTFTTPTNSSDSEEQSVMSESESESEIQSEDDSSTTPNYAGFILKLGVELATKITMSLIQKLVNSDSDEQQTSGDENNSSDTDCSAVTSFTDNNKLNVSLSEAKEKIVEKWSSILYKKICGHSDDGSKEMSNDDTLCDLFSQFTQR